MPDERKTIPIGRLKGAPWNPKTPIAGEYRKGLSASLDHFGVRDDLKVWPDPSSPGSYVALDGNQRLDVLRESGATEVECRVLADLDEEDAKLFTASFDRHQARYDESKLAALSASLKTKSDALKARLLRADVAAVAPPPADGSPELAGAKAELSGGTIPVMFSLSREGYESLKDSLLKAKSRIKREERLLEAVGNLADRDLDDRTIELALRLWAG